ncbi:hypothetical protein M145_4823, partial [Bacteroides fragilis str. 34-F-2 
KEIGCEREKEKCLREEIEEKIGRVTGGGGTGGKQKIRRDFDKD